jgi:hypothetical protein
MIRNAATLYKKDIFTMIQIASFITKVANMSQTTKVYVVSGTIVVSCVLGLVRQCNENAELKARVEHLGNLKEIDKGVKEVKNLTEKLQPPTIEDVENQNEAKNNNDRDSDDSTY